MAAVHELSAIFLFHFFLKLYLGEITVVCGKSEQSGHCDDLLYTIQLQVQQHGCRMPPRSYLRFAYLIITSRLATFFFTTQLQVQVFQIYIAKIHGDKG